MKADQTTYEKLISGQRLSHADAAKIAAARDLARLLRQARQALASQKETRS